MTTEPAYRVYEAQPSDVSEARVLLLQVLDLDYGYGFRPDVHGDIADLQGYYLDHSRHTLLIARHWEGEVAGVVGVRCCPPPANGRPPWLVARYGAEAAEVCRLSIAPAHRRRGLGRLLVDAARRWIVHQGSYTVIQLHTNARPSNAGPFWFSLPYAKMIWDGRGQDGYAPQVHFELELPQISAE